MESLDFGNEPYRQKSGHVFICYIHKFYGKSFEQRGKSGSCFPRLPVF